MSEQARRSVIWADGDCHSARLVSAEVSGRRSRTLVMETAYACVPEEAPGEQVPGASEKESYYLLVSG